MAKKKYCTYCIEGYQRTRGSNWGSSSIIEEGCDECQRRHAVALSSLEERKKSLQLVIDESSNEVSQLKADNDTLQKKVQFLQIRRDSSIGDIVITVPGLQVTAHRLILAAKSPVLQKKMVESETAEEPTEGIKLHNISPSVLKAVVEFCYTGELAFSELVPAEEVLIFAHTYELGLLEEYCEAELCRRVTVENLPQMLELSCKYDATRLQEETDKVFKKNVHLLTLPGIFKDFVGSDSSITEPSSGASPDLDEQHFDMVRSKGFEALEGSDKSIAESSLAACPDLDEQHFDSEGSNGFEVLEGSDNSIAESRSGACPDLDEQWNTV